MDMNKHEMSLCRSEIEPADCHSKAVLPPTPAGTILMRTGTLFGAVAGGAEPVQTPKENAEEDGTAAVDSRGVAELVADPGIVLRVDTHVASHQQIGERHGHE